MALVAGAAFNLLGTNKGLQYDEKFLSNRRCSSQDLELRGISAGTVRYGGS
jgi:hypothetical protein